MTAFASQGDREQALALGFDAHLAKPVTPVDLTRIAELLVERGGVIRGERG